MHMHINMHECICRYVLTFERICLLLSACTLNFPQPKTKIKLQNPAENTTYQYLYFRMKADMSYTCTYV